MYLSLHYANTSYSLSDGKLTGVRLTAPSQYSTGGVSAEFKAGPKTCSLSMTKEQATELAYKLLAGVAELNNAS